jgi:zinc protease
MNELRRNAFTHLAVTTLLAAIFLTLPAVLPASAAVKIQQVKSDRGITAWLVEDYSVPIISIKFAFRGGTTQDPVGKEGLVNLMTGLFDEGAGDLDSDAFQSRLDDAGAEMSFDAGRDALYGSMRMLAEEKDGALELLRLAIEKPRFDQAPVDRIRGQVVAGIMANSRDPETAAQLSWSKALYGDHPYSRQDEGTQESLATITPGDLRALHSKLFARDNLIVGVVGAIDAETLKTELDKLFGGLPEKSQLAPVPDVQPKLGREIDVTYDLSQTTLRFAFPGVARDRPEYFAAYLMNHILGGGNFTSRLFQEVREKRGLAYSVGSGLVNYDHSAVLAISTATRPDRAAETVQVIRDEVKRMAEKGVTADELAAAKKYVIGAYAINNLNNSSSIANTLVGLQLDRLGADYIERRVDLINRVTLDEVQAEARKLLSVAPSIMVLGQALDGGKG